METKTLFVANLPPDLHPDDLYDQFRPYGALDARIIEDKGIAFVEVPVDRLQEAIDDKHDSELFGYRLRVNEARPRE